MATAAQDDSRTRTARTPVGPERLLAYTVGREFRRLAMKLAVKGGGLRDPLDRASASILLNCAEAVGRNGRRDQARFFAIARGSAYECQAILDILEDAGVDERALLEARALLTRCVALLAGLVRRNAG